MQHALSMFTFIIFVNAVLFLGSNCPTALAPGSAFGMQQTSWQRTPLTVQTSLRRCGPACRWHVSGARCAGPAKARCTKQASAEGNSPNTGSSLPRVWCLGVLPWSYLGSSLAVRVGWVLMLLLLVVFSLTSPGVQARERGARGRGCHRFDRQVPIRCYP